jgi:hypothetical protein
MPKEVATQCDEVKDDSMEISMQQRKDTASFKLSHLRRFQ